MKIVVVLPTYNEKDNIARILMAIITQQKSMPGDSLSVLVVDDSSPDGTASIVKEFMKLYPNIHLLQGEKQGLGVAYIRGFKYAMSRMHADVVFEMDADFSHNPNDIPGMVMKIKEGSDFVIGSRYIPGGSIPKEWSPLRVLNSKFGNVFARYVAGLTNIKDCTSGYRAIRTSLLKRINLTKLNVKGYAFQMNLLFQAKKNGAIISEVPIHFKDRVYGKSKIKITDVTEFMYQSFLLRFPFLKVLLSKYTLSSIGILTLTALVIRFSQVVTAKEVLIFMIIFFSLLMTIQGIINIYFMIYAWEDIDNIEEDSAPKRYFPAKHSFTAIIPARHEEHVITDTIKAVSNISYPERLKEVLIVCRIDDGETIRKAKEMITKLGKSNIRIITFDDYPINKPHSLNIGLAEAKNEVVVVFDAEDQPHKNIYQIINTIMLRDNADVIQSGVQLMNYRSNWFSTLNVLEYFFWFKSTLHLFAKMGSIPLGGNTVFFKKKLLTKVGGWNEECLTEDAEIGIRLSKIGANIRVVYDEESVTREETPHDVGGFIKQRTRWNFGFMQILLDNTWRELPTRLQRFLAVYVLLMPELQASSILFIPISIFMMLAYKLPVVFALFSLIPMFVLLLQLVIYTIGLYEFTKAYKLPFALHMPLKIAITFFPFQLLLGISSFRAMTRLALGDQKWEKTLHLNAHREIVDITPAY